MKTYALVIVACFGMHFEGAAAQSCPSRLDIVSEAKEVATGWIHNSHSQTYNLAGVSIIYGRMASSESELEENLAPDNIGGAQFWPFRDVVGEHEMWMRCFYKGTPIKLSTRINADAVECYTERSGSQKAQNLNVVANCVKVRKYSKNYTSRR